MEEEQFVAPAGVTVSTLLPTAGIKVVAPPEPATAKKKRFKKHKGVKVRLGRVDDLIDEDELDASAGSEEEDDEGVVIREVVYTGTRVNLPQFKTAVQECLKEFLAEQDYEECSRTLRDLHTPFFHYEFVRKALTIGIERSDSERELISRLLSYSYGVDIHMESIKKGFERLFETIDDLALDVPDARQLAAKFLARAVADEILPPAYLSDPYVESLAGDIIGEAKALLSIKHSTERLEHVWHINGAFSVPELKASIVLALKEYFLESDIDECVRCIRELRVPLFHHEVVYRTLVLTLESWPSEKLAENAIKLLKKFRDAEVVSEYLMFKGFERCQSSLEDIALDAPEAKKGFVELYRRAVDNHVLPPGDREETSAAPSK